jgi:hypothetical protein
MNDFYSQVTNPTKDEIIQKINELGVNTRITGVDFWLKELDRRENNEQLQASLQLAQKSLDVGEQSRDLAKDSIELARKSLEVAQRSLEASERSIQVSRLGVLIAVAAIFVSAITSSQNSLVSWIFGLALLAFIVIDFLFVKRR